MQETIKKSKLYKNAIEVVAKWYVECGYDETDFETLRMLFDEYDSELRLENRKEEN